MPANNKIVLALAAIILAVFGYGLLRLFELRFEAGDVYPPYSSLRADPLGAKAYYESLQSLNGISVARNFKPLEKLEGRGGTTLLLVGAAGPSRWPRELEHFVLGGGRLVVTFEGSEREPGKPTRKVDPEVQEMERLWKLETVSPEDWGATFEWEKRRRGDDRNAPNEAFLREGDALPKTLHSRSRLAFTSLDPSWRVLYERGDRAVLIERPLGAGTVVLFSDSYFLSNEALRDDRHPELLAWLVGSSSRVVFDETHLGVAEDPGVAALVRKYRLEWVAAALLVLAGLFAWQGAVRFLPPRGEERGPEAAWVEGKDSATAFVNLLRRNIAQRDILNTCATEWEKSLGQAPGWSPARLEKAREAMRTFEALPPRQRDPVSAYESIRRILTENK